MPCVCAAVTLIYNTIFLLPSLCMTDPRFIHLGSADASSLAWRSVTAQSGEMGQGMEGQVGGDVCIRNDRNLTTL